MVNYTFNHVLVVACGRLGLVSVALRCFSGTLFTLLGLFLWKTRPKPRCVELTGYAEARDNVNYLVRSIFMEKQDPNPDALN